MILLSRVQIPICMEAIREMCPERIHYCANSVFVFQRLDTELYTASLLPPSLRLNSLFGHKLIKFYQEKYVEQQCGYTCYIDTI